MRIAVVAAAIAVLLTGCAAPRPPIQFLNEAGRSVSMVDIANLLEPRDIPYEIQEQGNLAVGYNLIYLDSGPVRGARLTLFFRNSDTEPKVIEPLVALSDRNGIMIPASTYEGFVRDAAMLAGTAVPPMPTFTPATTTSTTTGTIRNTQTGNSYRYEVDTTTRSGGPLTNAMNGYAEGVAIRQAREAAEARDAGRLMLRWANAFWLRQSYTLPPSRATGGALHFPALSPSQLPLTLTVEVAGKTFSFNTRRTLQ